jgi:hypothetical protein
MHLQNFDSTGANTDSTLVDVLSLNAALNSVSSGGYFNLVSAGVLTSNNRPLYLSADNLVTVSGSTSTGATGTLVGCEPCINFVTGPNLSFTLFENLAHNRVDVELNPLTIVDLAGVFKGAEPAINFIAGNPNITYTINDNAGASRVDVTINGLVQVAQAGSVISTQPIINFINGTNTTVTVQNATPLAGAANVKIDASLSNITGWNGASYGITGSGTAPCGTDIIMTPTGPTWSVGGISLSGTKITVATTGKYHIGFTVQVAIGAATTPGQSTVSITYGTPGVSTHTAVTASLVVLAPSGSLSNLFESGVNNGSITLSLTANDFIEFHIENSSGSTTWDAADPGGWNELFVYYISP